MQAVIKQAKLPVTYALIAHFEKSALLVGANVVKPANCIPIEAGFANPHNA